MEERAWKHLFLRTKEEVCMLPSFRQGYCSAARLCPELYISVVLFSSVLFVHATHWARDSVARVFTGV